MSLALASKLSLARPHMAKLYGKSLRQKAGFEHGLESIIEEVRLNYESANR